MHTILLALISGWFPDHYVEQVPYFFGACLLPIVLWVKEYIRWPLIAMAGYLSVSAVIMPIHPALGWFPPKEVIVWGVMLLAGWFVRDGFRSPYWVPWLILVTFMGAPAFYNTALNQAFMVAILPYAPAWQVPLTALFMLTQPLSLSAWMMFPVALLAHWPILSLGCVAAASGVLTAFPDYITSKMDRAVFWEYAGIYFQDNLSLWFGSGLGTFMILGAKIQSLNNFQMHNLWLSAHNDYLQWFFETGLVGVALLLWLVVDAGRRLDKRERLVGLSLGVLGVSYFPQDVPLFQLLACTLIIRGQVRERYLKA